MAQRFPGRHQGSRRVSKRIRRLHRLRRLIDAAGAILVRKRLEVFWICLPCGAPSPIHVQGCPPFRLFPPNR